MGTTIKIPLAHSADSPVLGGLHRQSSVWDWLGRWISFTSEGPNCISGLSFLFGGFPSTTNFRSIQVVVHFNSRWGCTCMILTRILGAALFVFLLSSFSLSSNYRNGNISSQVSNHIADSPMWSINFSIYSSNSLREIWINWENYYF